MNTKMHSALNGISLFYCNYLIVLILGPYNYKNLVFSCMHIAINIIIFAQNNFTSEFFIAIVAFIQIIK